jgi:hypothetical protein
MALIRKPNCQRKLIVGSEYDDLTIQYEEEGQVVVEELDKVLLQKGTWATVLFLYRQMDPKTGEMGPPRAGLRRYQKVHGQYRKRDAINLSEKSAPILLETLKKWFAI